jgi:uncharacterized protein YfaS (alpha-2-macroglobulin family)
MIHNALAAAFAAAVLSVSCSSDSGHSDAARRAPPDPSWVGAINMHSNGAMSRHVPVRVLFIKDIVGTDRVGTDASANVSISPAVKAHAIFASTREIILRPDTEFAPNTEYRVSVKADGLAGVPEGTKPFEFKVRTFEVNFAVNVGALNVEYEKNELMNLSGSIATSDREPREKLEKILTATLDGKPVAIQWIGGDLSYAFAITNILRKKEEQTLTLHWNGAPLGVQSKGEKSTRVPALDEFAVTQADAVEVNDQRQVQVHFSDAIDTRQDIKGLVRLSQGEFTTRIQGNLLTLYVNQDLVGKVTLTLEEALRSRASVALSGERSFELEFTNTRPQVRWVGQGVILPDAKTLSIPFEAVSARSVRVTALQVFEPNIPQFLQVNNLSGRQELGRVGDVLWRKTIPLTSQVKGRWTRYNLDVTELTAKHPGALFQLTLSISSKDAVWDCPGGNENSELEDPQPVSAMDNDGYEASNWDYYNGEEYYGYDANVRWEDRDDPCKQAYYRFRQDFVRATRNLLASNIGLIAKRGPKGKLLVVATSLDSAKPKPGVNVEVLSYQNQVLASGRTDANGTVELEPRSQPFALIANDNGRKGYLRIGPGVALPVSHFDVGGETVVDGLKGHLYGDRGVWRPGDSIYLTFALQDRAKTLPPNHPVTLELRNPRGQLVQTLTNATPVGQFYAFELKTAADAPTGNWEAMAQVGGARFTKTLKVETVMPNRLRIDLDLGDKPVIASSPVQGSLDAQWLSGATAANLRAQVEVRLSPITTRFSRNTDYEFDDPARGFNGSPWVFEEKLDANGHADLDWDLSLPRDVPGMMNATFVTRVFERGGAFSINLSSQTVAPFDRYVGLKLPKGDAARDMLLTDTQHTVELASLDREGKPVSIPRLQVTLYKVEWRWWWDSSGDSLAQYVQGQSNSIVGQQIVSTRDGAGKWQFQVNYPEWGRYLVRACDLDGGHCSGRVFYIDWPSWAGAAREQSGPAANILMITADKPEYKVGETATIQLPEAAQGRALLTLENGSSVLEYRWIEASSSKEKPGANRIQVPITAGMAPNIYVAVTMVQPHAGKDNDRPIRLYGVIPLKVTDPSTRLTPVVASAAEWAPKSKATVTVSESTGRAMNYTLAIVDEGLLGLTNFKTPNLRDVFYQREALGVSTWDLFDEVAGAYGGELDRLLALGGSDAAKPVNPDEGKSRFPPVVKFLGPFALKAGEKRPHSVDLPEYVGAVRVMVVAGDGSAYGSADKSVFVRQALMILPTLPRVIGPDEAFRLPVSVFTAEAAIKDVKLEVQTDALFSVVGEKTAQIAFTRPEEKLGFLSLKSGSKLGKGRIRVVATSGRYRAESEVWLEVRTPNVAQTRFDRATVAPGESWSTALKSFGLEGSQVATLEVSALPPVNIDGRMQYLIHYPHGCLEQTTSAVFPQLYLPALIRLTQNQRLQVENNVRAGVGRLRTMQHNSGGFAYWPGVWSTDPALDWRNDWGTTYAGHFMLEAEKAGYSLPGDMKSSWLRFQKERAQRWTPNSYEWPGEKVERRVEAARYAQAYRLFTLALAGQPEIGAMNRLRESRAHSIGERWMLVSAYKLAGKADVASQLAQQDKLQALVFTEANPYTFGSLLRDRAVVLMGLTLLGRDADTHDLLEDVSKQLSSESWYSTQTVSFALVAVAQNAGSKPFTGFSFDYAAGKSRNTVKGEAPVSSITLPAPSANGMPLELRNTSDRKLYVTASVRAVPRSGEEQASANGLVLAVSYSDSEGNAVDIAKVPQGMDLIAQITVKNVGARGLDNLALSQLVPAGWEIRNDRLENVDTSGERKQDEAYRGSYWWVPNEWRNQQLRQAEYVDIRDDRVQRYFSLRTGESIFFETRLNAAYLGRYYLPGASIEAMYDATQHARLKGQWIEVVSPQR